MLPNTSHCHTDLIEISYFVLTFQHPGDYELNDTDKPKSLQYSPFELSR
jgi:hypothetical protein